MHHRHRRCSQHVPPDRLGFTLRRRLYTGRNTGSIPDVVRVIRDVVPVGGDGQAGDIAGRTSSSRYKVRDQPLPDAVCMDCMLHGFIVYLECSTLFGKFDGDAICGRSASVRCTFSEKSVWLLWCRNAQSEGRGSMSPSAVVPTPVRRPLSVLERIFSPRWRSVPSTSLFFGVGSILQESCRFSLCLKVDSVIHYPLGLGYVTAE